MSGQQKYTQPMVVVVEVVKDYLEEVKVDMQTGGADGTTTAGGNGGNGQAARNGSPWWWWWWRRF